MLSEGQGARGKDSIGRDRIIRIEKVLRCATDTGVHKDVGKKRIYKRTFLYPSHKKHPPSHSLVNIYSKLRRVLQTLVIKKKMKEKH